MNTALLILSGMAAGLAATLLPKRRRPGAQRGRLRPPQREQKALEKELAPFVHFD